jgi:hypothetical protein
MKTRQIRLGGLPRLVIAVFTLASAALVLAAATPFFTRTTITNDCDPQIPAPIVAADACDNQVAPTRNWSQDISWFDPDFDLYYLADRSNFGATIVDTTDDSVEDLAAGLCGPAGSTTLGSKLNCKDAGPNGVVVADNGVVLLSSISIKAPYVGAKELFVGDGDSALKGFPLDSFGFPLDDTGPSHCVSTGGNSSHNGTGDADRSDELAFDPDHNLILIANDKGSPFPFVSIIDVTPDSLTDCDYDTTFQTYATDNVVGQIIYDGDVGTDCPLFLDGDPACHHANVALSGIEQPQWVPSEGKFFMAVPQTDVNAGGQIDVIDPITMAVEKSYKLSKSFCIPHGLTVGPSVGGHNRLLVGCNGGSAVPGTNGGPDTPSDTPLISLVMDSGTGKIIANINKVGGSDEVWYNSFDNRYYLAASSHTADGKVRNPASKPRPVLGIIDAGTNKFIMNIDTGSGAHSAAAVGFKKVYVPIRTDSRADGKPEAGGIAVYTTK